MIDLKCHYSIITPCMGLLVHEQLLKSIKSHSKPHNYLEISRQCFSFNKSVLPIQACTWVHMSPLTLLRFTKLSHTQVKGWTQAFGTFFRTICNEVTPLTFVECQIARVVLR